MRAAFRVVMGAIALSILVRVMRWLAEVNVPVAQAKKQDEPGPTHVIGTCEGCGSYVLPDEPHTFMDHINKPAHASCVAFGTPDEAN